MHILVIFSYLKHTLLYDSTKYHNNSLGTLMTVFPTIIHIWMTLQCAVSEDSEQLDVEVESRARWNDASRTPRAIAKLAWNNQTTLQHHTYVKDATNGDLSSREDHLSPDLHAEQPLVPSLDHAPSSHGKLKGLPPVV